ncbi:MAG: hypothetical protein E5Y10_09750 [Mesorhizobium sp.]|uniref:hypothetical protein n=1 Tax=Mesorhizobium sp. TaxID=1871066 RepID=UPI00121AD418|nr:hypothetical protein [Mesorhizobium sp.]TIN40321.1 MAG: hypothetical protein E5Y13_11005 [Mesorhizobium sp.]TJU87462.1 MAG: hypothetical protein E5Y15_07495 [Mesorhizobium sp.]TJU90711.1 MAG: hypothetical protein E5Y10_09750 [Mesorhizobium sp.]
MNKLQLRSDAVDAIKDIAARKSMIDNIIDGNNSLIELIDDYKYAETAEQKIDNLFTMQIFLASALLKLTVCVPDSDSGNHNDHKNID